MIISLNTQGYLCIRLARDDEGLWLWADKGRTWRHGVGGRRINGQDCLVSRIQFNVPPGTYVSVWVRASVLPNYSIFGYAWECCKQVTVCHRIEIFASKQVSWISDMRGWLCFYSPCGGVCAFIVQFLNIDTAPCILLHCIILATMNCRFGK